MEKHCHRVEIRFHSGNDVTVEGKKQCEVLGNWQGSLNKVSLSLSEFVEGAIKLVNSCCGSHLASLHH